MPSSLVFAALVVAWLAVLVPVIARRRQMVPRPAEADLSARVLPRSWAASAREEIAVSDGAAGSTAVAERDALEHELDRELDRDNHDDEGDDDGYDVPEVHAEDLDDDLDDEPAPARPYRPGRGGFNAEAAEAAAHARYAFRQRVALGLIALAVVSALAALVVSSVLWGLHAATDVALVGYLFFLRRQTRIEEEVRERRAARAAGERRALEARRERQAEHEARMAEAQAWGSWDDADEQEWAEAGEYDDDGHDEGLDAADEVDDAPRWAAPRTPAPPVPAGMELVADSEDDPAFHALDALGAERVPAYRRAAGA